MNKVSESERVERMHEGVKIQPDPARERRKLLTLAGVLFLLALIAIQVAEVIDSAGKGFSVQRVLQMIGIVLILTAGIAWAWHRQKRGHKS